MQQTNSKSPRWLKCNLYIHTPISRDQKSSVTKIIWEQFISSLESLLKEYKVFGLNDNFVDGYEKILKFKKEERLQNIGLILPIIELRIFEDTEQDESKKINYNTAFSNRNSIATSKMQFLTRIELSYKYINKTPYLENCSDKWFPSNIIERY